jgi:hypothetical protein
MSEYSNNLFAIMQQHRVKSRGYVHQNNTEVRVFVRGN